VLHVVWSADSKTSTTLPTIAIKDSLDAPLAELHAGLADGWGDQSAMLTGQCYAPLRNLAVETWSEVVRQAAQVRLQSKAAQFQARARQIGWERALWEGIRGARLQAQCVAHARQRNCFGLSNWMRRSLLRCKRNSSV
jgi:hypothetical protein